jgi:hypothetical protein
MSYDTSKAGRKVVLDAKISNLSYVQFSQNPHFKFLPVDFRYYQTSGKQSKKFGH